MSSSAARRDELGAVAVEQLDQPPLGDSQRADLGVDVAPGVPRRAVIGHDQPPKLEVVLVAPDDLDRRDPQALLEDLGGIGGEAADGLAADLRQVADVGDEPAQLVLVEDGTDHRMLGDVSPAAVGIVVEHDVAGLERVDPELLHRPADDEHARRELRGAELRLSDHVAAVVEQHAREVEPLVEDRREGGPGHRDPHLAADVHEAVVEDRELDRIDLAGPLCSACCHRSYSVSSSCDGRARRACAALRRLASQLRFRSRRSHHPPGGTTTVVSIDSTISGPNRDPPPTNSARATTGVGWNPSPK